MQLWNIYLLLISWSQIVNEIWNFFYLQNIKRVTMNFRIYPSNLFSLSFFYCFCIEWKNLCTFNIFTTINYCDQNIKFLLFTNYKISDEILESTPWTLSISFFLVTFVSNKEVFATLTHCYRFLCHKVWKKIKFILFKNINIKYCDCEV